MNLVEKACYNYVVLGAKYFLHAISDPWLVVSGLAVVAEWQSFRSSTGCETNSHATASFQIRWRQLIASGSGPKSKLICPSRTVPVHIENCYTGNRRTNLWFSKCRPKSESDARDKRGMDTLRKPLPIPRFAVCLFFFSPLPGLVVRSDGAAVIKLLNETEVILSVRCSLFFDAFLVESCWIFQRKSHQELSTSKHLYLGAFFYL